MFDPDVQIGNGDRNPYETGIVGRNVDIGTVGNVASNACWLYVNIVSQYLLHVTYFSWCGFVNSLEHMLHLNGAPVAYASSGGAGGSSTSPSYLPSPDDIWVVKERSRPCEPSAD